MRILTRRETADFLRSHDNFAILSHRRPDGDTAGSSALLCLGLRKLGKKAFVLENPELTEKYVSLHAGITKPAPQEGDCIVSVDVASRKLIPEVYAPWADKVCLRIDHHRSGDSFSNAELVDGNAAACGEIVYDVLQELGIALDIPMANALYIAISTDTGCFRYANTTAATFRTAAVCAGISPDLFDINQALFETNTLPRLRLEGWLVENAMFLQGGKAVICALPKHIEQELALTEDDLENISGFPRSIAGVKIAATLRQEDAQTVKLSVRAVPGYDASAICAVFGGGGHKGAAGASIRLPMDEAVQAVKAQIPVIDG